MSNIGITKFKMVPRDLEGKKVDVSTATIYNAGSSTLATLYSDTKATSQSNPITVTDGTINFYGYMPSFDVVVTLADGSTVTKAGMEATDTRIVTDTSITQGNVVEGAGQKTADLIKTKSWSIGVPANATTVDLSFATDDGDNPSTAENDGIALEDVIPAYAKVVDLSVITTETADVVTAISVGTAASGTQYHTEATMTTLAAIMQFANGALGEVAAVATDGAVHITGNPSGAWDSYTTGKWRLSVTYIDYGQLID